MLVGGVGGDLFDGCDQGLVEEGLADVAGVVGEAEGVVGEDGGFGVHHDVDVGGSACVVAGEDGLELGYAVGVGRLDPAEPGLLGVGLVGGVAVAVGDDAAVHAGGVAVPDLDVNVGDGLAGGYVDDLVVEEQGNARLVLDHILADVLASHV